MTDQTPNQQAELLPFHALNEFMRNDFRIRVVRTTLTKLPGLPGNYRTPIERLIKKNVRVPGFRNSEKAPASIKAAPAADVFEKNPEMVVAILNAWAEIQADLRTQVYEFLKNRNWVVLPLEADRTRFPGFFVQWPEGEEFELLNQAFKELHPGTPASSDEISLMIVWVAMRIPLQMEKLDVINKSMNVDDILKSYEQIAAGQKRETGE